ncbi:MAG: 2-dehydropantoate 2-reductase [Elusimicrobia bacterium]|nr:2-dehydropantoate 2-reductase [Elusimicrobiota bacterium]
MNVGVLGPGAAGLFLLSRLIGRSERPPVLIARNQTQAKRLKQDGFVVVAGGQSAHYSSKQFTVSFKPISLDVIFLAVKSYDLPKALDSARRCTATNGLLICLSNGVFDLKRIRSLAGKRRVLFGSLMVGLDRVEAGRVLCHGEREAPLMMFSGDQPDLERIRPLLDDCAVSFKITAGSVEDLLWSKSAYLAALGPLSALLRKTNGEIVSSEAVRDLAQSVFEEALAVLKASGRRAVFFAEALNGGFPALLEKTKGNRSSMLQDAAAGRRTELDFIVKPFLDAGRKTGVPCPLLNQLYMLTKTYVG